MNDLGLSSAEYETNYFQMVHANHPTDVIDTIQYDTIQSQLETHKHIVVAIKACLILASKLIVFKYSTLKQSHRFTGLRIKCKLSSSEFIDQARHCKNEITTNPIDKVKFQIPCGKKQNDIKINSNYSTLTNVCCGL